MHSSSPSKNGVQNVIAALNDDGDNKADDLENKGSKCK